MEDQREAIREVEDVQERHFLPVQEKEEEEEEELPVQPAGKLRDETTVTDERNGAGRPTAGREEAKVNGTHPGDSAETPGEIPNGCHASPNKPVTSVAKQPSLAIVNRTARPFFSPSTVQTSPGPSPQMDIPPAPSYATPPLPAFPEPPTPTYAVEPPLHAFAEPPRSGTARPAFSPPPPAPSYPTPPLPSYSSPLPGPSPVPHYMPPTAPKPTFIPQMLSERRPQTPIRTGILDEGGVRRGPRKAMFTFQEKPKVAPNPELLSLVQGADERKKQRPLPAESVPEEELLALGAEASNFMAKEEVLVEEPAPAWSSCLKSSRTPAAGRVVEHKPEQNLANASGKGAELFARRQSRMEKYVLDNTAKRDRQIRSPSPTMSLPPSWVYPSNMPGRVKAIANASNISEQISKTLKAQQAKNSPAPATAPAPPVPPPAPQSPVLENGCTRMEMELAKHQPYQLNSSLFILSPTKDPMSSLPRAAPPPKSMVTGQQPYLARQTSLPTNVSSQFSTPGGYRPACFSPPLPLSPREVRSPVTAYGPERVASPRSAGQAPRPTFSARKAGIEAQVWKPSYYYYNPHH